MTKTDTTDRPEWIDVIYRHSMSLPHLAKVSPRFDAVPTARRYNHSIEQDGINYGTVQMDHIVNPYLSVEAGRPNAYTEGMLASLKTLKPFTSKGKWVQLEKKLQLRNSTINEGQFLQSACELTVCAYFATRYAATFEYEPVVAPPKDVDCAFVDDGFRFNIEVKCADFSKKHAADQKRGFHLSNFGRHDAQEQMLQDLARVVVHDPEGRPLVVRPYMDNKLKDFLVSAHQKFSDSSSDDILNVLAVCCDTVGDMQQWLGYMCGNEGLFTDESYHPVSDFARVDVVLLSNLYHRHHNYRQKDQLTGHWDLGQAFNLAFLNPARQRTKQAAVLHFLTTLPNHTKEFFEYRVEDGVPLEDRLALHLRLYVADNLANSRMFQ